MADVCFSKLEIVSRRLSYNYEIWFADRNWHPKRATLYTDPKPEVKLRRSGCHLENRYNILSPLMMDRFGRNSSSISYAALPT